MIVDTSVLIAILHRESDAENLARRLLSAQEVLVSAGTLLETHLVAARESTAAELDELLRTVGAEIVPVDARQAPLPSTVSAPSARDAIQQA